MIDLHLVSWDPTRDLEQDLMILDAVEHAKAARFRRASDRSLYVQAHAFLRRVLSQYADVSPQAWRFQLGIHGKPQVCPRLHPGSTTLCFNMSHCRDKVAVVVATNLDVGVDIERLDALQDVQSIAAMILSPQEAQGLDVDGIAVQRFLIDRWTQKEAALKALGLGLGIVEPSAMTVFVRLDQGLDISLNDDGSSAELCGPEHWYLRSGSEDGLHIWAVACAGVRTNDVGLRIVT